MPLNQTPPSPRTNGPVSEAEAATLRIRRLLNMERDTALTTAERICRVVQAAGRAVVDADFGDQAADFVADYAALTAFILAVDPNAQVPSLPEDSP